MTGIAAPWLEMWRDARGRWLNLSAEVLLKAAFENLYNAVLITDADFDGGPFVRCCNPAFSAMTGYTQTEIFGRSPRILQGPDTDREVIDRLSRAIRAGDFFEGSTINYRKDGIPYVVHWNISAVRDAAGEIIGYISIQQDITTQVETTKQNRLLNQRLEWQAKRLRSELASAAHYASSILPNGLDGVVTVSSRCLPARELGGDSFDYLWIDGDHLLVYLIDVSGHGLEPALLSVSVHNMLRARSMSNEILLRPAAALTQLNQRFQMEQHNFHYFTMWYGVYQASTRTLCYASAGAPPALMIQAAPRNKVAVTELPATSKPVGMFTDAEFTSRMCVIPPGSQLLVYSDGASEIALADGRQMRWEEFANLISRVASSPAWTLDELVDELRGLTPGRTFEDDCALMQLTFD